MTWNQKGAPRISNGGGCSIIAYTARPHHIPQTTTMQPYLELGLDTFGDVTHDADGRPLPQAQVIRHVIDEAVLADELGVDFIGVGEHHRADFAVASPEVVLAAIAGRTHRIRLGSAVTELSTVTAEPSRMRFVRPAMAARTTSGDETAKSACLLYTSDAADD